MARYSEQSRRPGELSAPEAAQILGVTSATICRWCRLDIMLPPDAVRVDVAQRYWILERAVVRIQARAEARLLLSEQE